MTRTVEREKWVFRRHTKDFNKLCVVAKAIKIILMLQYLIPIKLSCSNN